MNVFRLFLIALLVELLVISSFTGCKSKHKSNHVEKVKPADTNETNSTDDNKSKRPKRIYEEDDNEPRYNHDDVEIIRLYGFEDACKKCNKGYRTKLVCGYAYNPECAKYLTDELELNSEFDTSKRVLQDILNSIKEVQNGKR